MTTNTVDLIEQFADGEPVTPDALIAALATTEGREHLRGVLELRALMAEAPITPEAKSPTVAANQSPWLSIARIAAAALLATVAAAGGYVAGTRQAGTTTNIATVERVDVPPAPTTVIKLDATHGWRDQSGGF